LGEKKRPGEVKETPKLLDLKSRKESKTRAASQPLGWQKRCAEEEVRWSRQPVEAGTSDVRGPKVSKSGWNPDLRGTAEVSIEASGRG